MEKVQNESSVSTHIAALNDHNFTSGPSYHDEILMTKKFDVVAEND